MNRVEGEIEPWKLALWNFRTNQSDVVGEFAAVLSDEDVLRDVALDYIPQNLAAWTLYTARRWSGASVLSAIETVISGLPPDDLPWEKAVEAPSH